MKQIPETENALVLRTDFSNDAVWKEVCNAIQEPVGEFQTYVDFLGQREYDKITVEQVISLIPEESDRSFIFVVDQITISHPDHPVLCLDLVDEPGRTFRVIPSELWSVENNLSLANSDFRNFADSVDPDGVFRGSEAQAYPPPTPGTAVVIYDGQNIIRFWP